VLRYRPRGWSERAVWHFGKRRWLLPLGDIPEDARYVPSEREWIADRPGSGDYRIERRCYRPEDGTLSCVVNIRDDAAKTFDFVRFHNDGSLAMEGSWVDGRWHGDKVDYPCKSGKSSEHFILHTIPEKMQKAVSGYDRGTLVSRRFFDLEGREIDARGLPLGT
jgi:hypothetical protein